MKLALYIRKKDPLYMRASTGIDTRYCYICLFIVWMIISCGYRFAGVGQLPSGVHHICVAVLENSTAETGIETILSNDLIYEFTRGGHRVVRTKAEADATLAGRIVSMNIDTISHRTAQRTQEVRVTLALNLTLTDTDGNVIWFVNPISENQSYEVVTGDKSGTEQNHRMAIEALSKRLAQTVYNHLTAGF